MMNDLDPWAFCLGFNAAFDGKTLSACPSGMDFVSFEQGFFMGRFYLSASENAFFSDSAVSLWDAGDEARGGCHGFERARVL
jgi:hypothetical protein